MNKMFFVSLVSVVSLVGTQASYGMEEKDVFKKPTAPFRRDPQKVTSPIRKAYTRTGKDSWRPLAPIRNKTLWEEIKREAQDTESFEIKKYEIRVGVEKKIDGCVEIRESLWRNYGVS